MADSNQDYSEALSPVSAIPEAPWASAQPGQPAQPAPRVTMPTYPFANEYSNSAPDKPGDYEKAQATIAGNRLAMQQLNQQWNKSIQGNPVTDGLTAALSVFAPRYGKAVGAILDGSRKHQAASIQAQYQAFAQNAHQTAELLKGRTDQELEYMKTRAAAEKENAELAFKEREDARKTGMFNSLAPLKNANMASTQALTEHRKTMNYLDGKYGDATRQAGIDQKQASAYASNAQPEINAYNAATNRMNAQATQAKAADTINTLHPALIKHFDNIDNGSVEGKNLDHAAQIRQYDLVKNDFLKGIDNAKMVNDPIAEGRYTNAYNEAAKRQQALIDQPGLRAQPASSLPQAAGNPTAGPVAQIPQTHPLAQPQTRQQIKQLLSNPQTHAQGVQMLAKLKATLPQQAPGQQAPPPGAQAQFMPNVDSGPALPRRLAAPPVVQNGRVMNAPPNRGGSLVGVPAPPPDTQNLMPNAGQGGPPSGDLPEGHVYYPVNGKLTAVPVRVAAAYEEERLERKEKAEKAMKERQAAAGKQQPTGVAPTPAMHAMQLLSGIEGAPSNAGN